MAFPKRLLVPGEELVLDLRPHPVALALPAIATVVVLVGGFWIISKLNGVVNWIVLAVMIALLIVYPIRRLTWWLTAHFVVTSDRVIQRRGWIAKDSMEIPLEAINDIRFTQGVFERMIGAGDLVIRSAANSDPTTFEDVRKPEEVQKAIYHQAEMNNQRMYSGRGAPVVAPPAPVTPSEPQPPRSAPSSVTELERLADLRARGVLTDEEFQAQKAKILGQQ